MVEYALLLDEFDVAFKVGFDSYWTRPAVERETILAADRILSAIRIMTEYEAREANKPQGK